MTDQTIAFIDTETTSLRHDRRAWEVALILRRPGQEDIERSWFVDPADLDLGNADLQSLTFGRYFDRHPWYDGTASNRDMFGEGEVLHTISKWTRGAILMGSNPSFDAEMLAARMRAHGICPAWHYHLEDVPTLALGWLHGSGRVLPDTRKSDQISLACGVDPGQYDRHSALGDCRWIRDLYDVVTSSVASR